LPLRGLAITAMLVAGLAITASGASAAKKYGVWTVQPGHTLHLTNMFIEAAAIPGVKPWDEETAYIYIDGFQGAAIANNVGSSTGGDHPPDHPYTNTDTKTHTVTLDLRDFTHPCDSFSFGPNAVVFRQGTGVGEHPPGAGFLIHDGSPPGCGTSPIGPGVQVDFWGNVSITPP
jgi:hypothetical protein